MQTWLTHLVWLPLVILSLTALLALPRLFGALARLREIRQLAPDVAPIADFGRVRGLVVSCRSAGDFRIHLPSGPTPGTPDPSALGNGTEPRHFRVTPEDPRLLHWLRNDPHASLLIGRLLKGSRTHTLRLAGQRLSLYADLEPHDFAALRTMIVQLRELAKRVPALEPEPGAASAMIDRIRRLARILPTAALTLAAYVYVFEIMDRGFPQHAAPVRVMGLGVLAGLPLVGLLHLWILLGLRGHSRRHEWRATAGFGLYLPILMLAALAAHQINLKVPGSALRTETVGVLHSTTDFLEPTRLRPSKITLQAFGEGKIPSGVWYTGYEFAADARSAGPLEGRSVRVQWRLGGLGQPLVVHPPEILPDTPRSIPR